MAGSPAFLRALAEAHDWCEALGHASAPARHCRLVSDVAHPRLWSGNHASAVTAQTPDEIERTLADIDSAFVHSPYRVVDADAFTPPAFLARLALDGWEEQPAAILMALTGPPPLGESPAVAFRAVERDEDWAALARLHALDLSEGGRTGAAHVEDVAKGLFHSMRAKAAHGRIFLASIDGRACAYALALPAPGGLGLIDDVFTDPDLRRRGVASALVGRCVAHLNAEGGAVAFLTARVSDTPKRLYARLGFAPAMLVRRWVKRVA